MKRFILAATAAFTILAGVLVGGITSPALAHHPVIVGSSSCATPAGAYTVGWTVTADAVRGLTWTIDGVTKPDSASFTYTTSHNLSGLPPSLTKTATWSNGITSTVTGTTGKPGRCEAPLPTTTTTPAPPATTTTTEAPSTTTTTSSPAPSTTVPDAIPASSPTTSEPPTATTTTVPPVTTSVAVGLPPVPPTTEGDATSQAPGVPPVPPSGLPKTGLKRDNAKIAATLLLAGLLALAVRKVERS